NPAPLGTIWRQTEQDVIQKSSTLVLLFENPRWSNSSGLQSSSVTITIRITARSTIGDVEGHGVAWLFCREPRLRGVRGRLDGLRDARNGRSHRRKTWSRQIGRTQSRYYRPDTLGTMASTSASCR